MQEANKLILFPLRNRSVIFTSGFIADWSESRWPPKPEEWLAARDKVFNTVDLGRLLEIASAESGFTQVRSEIIGLLQRLRQREPQTVVEVGTHKGGNSFLFCHALPTVKHVVGVDLWVQNAPKLIYFERPGQYYHALHGDSQTASMLHKVKERLGGRQVDFLFIDGDHSFQGVCADFQLYAPLVRPGGIVAFHDIVPDHRTRYGRDTGCYAGEVFHFWRELKQHYYHEELIDDAGQDGFGIGLIEVPAGGIQPLQHV